jgi:hypothetical protein
LLCRLGDMPVYSLRCQTAEGRKQWGREGGGGWGRGGGGADAQVLGLGHVSDVTELTVSCHAVLCRGLWHLATTIAAQIRKAKTRMHKVPIISQQSTFGEARRFRP